MLALMILFNGCNVTAFNNYSLINKLENCLLDAVCLTSHLTSTNHHAFIAAYLDSFVSLLNSAYLKPLTYIVRKSLFGFVWSLDSCNCILFIHIPVTRFVYSLA